MHRAYNIFKRFTHSVLSKTFQIKRDNGYYATVSQEKYSITLEKISYIL